MNLTMAIWYILIVLIVCSWSAGLIFILYGKVSGGRDVLIHNLKVRQDELKLKKDLLTELALTSLGYCTDEDLKGSKESVMALEERLRSQKGRLTITEAELEAVETRLRELEEIERELESSSIEAGRELEMLRGQEREFTDRNGHLQQMIDATEIAIDLLTTQLAEVPDLANRIKRSKQLLAEAQEKIGWYSTEISNVNRKYMDLKRAYDALDIEYAQLYEKQNALMANQPQP